MLQIIRAKIDNLWIIFHMTLLNVCCDTSLEPSRRDDSNEWSQHMFLLRNKKKISLNYPQCPPHIWSSGQCQKLKLKRFHYKKLCLIYSEKTKIAKLVTITVPCIFPKELFMNILIRLCRHMY